MAISRPCTCAQQEIDACGGALYHPCTVFYLIGETTIAAVKLRKLKTLKRKPVSWSYGSKVGVTAVCIPLEICVSGLGGHAKLSYRIRRHCVSHKTINIKFKICINMSKI